MASTSLSYDDYLKYINPTLGWTGGGDAGMTRDANYVGMTKDQWDALSSGDKFHRLAYSTGNGMSGGADTPLFDNSAGADDIAAFQQKYGTNNYSAKDANGKTISGAPGAPLEWGYGDLPTQFGEGFDKYAIDPSRVLRMPDGRWVIESSNIKGNWLANQQNIQSAADKKNAMIAMAIMASAAGGAALAGGAAGAAPAVAAGASDAATTGGFLSGADIAASGAAGSAGTAGAAGTAGGLVGNAGLDGYAGAFDSEGASGLAGSSYDALAAGGAAPAGGGFNPETGQWTDLQPMDPVHAGQLPGLDAYTGNSNFLSQLNTGRQYFNGARSVMNLLSGGQGQSGPRSNGMASGNTSDILSALLGGNGTSGGGLLGGLLGLIANGHSMFGNGVGTASGAQAAADKASALADPWGSSGHRGQFADMMTPDRVMGLLSQDPSQVLNNPAYRFDMDQGTHAINMGDAAQGTLRSGNRGIELQNYGQGLASKYGQQYFNNNLSVLSALSGLAGVNAGSPTAAAQAQMNGFDNASNIRNAGVNGLSGGLGTGAVGNTMSGLAGLLKTIFGGDSSGGFDMSSVDFGNLPAFNDTNGWNPNDFFSYTDDSGSLADATGAFF